MALKFSNAKTGHQEKYMNLDKLRVILQQLEAKPFTESSIVLKKWEITLRSTDISLIFISFCFPVIMHNALID